MGRWWTNLFDKVWDHIVTEERAVDGTAAWDEAPDVAAIDAARNDWVTARMYFDNVTDPDLVDHAIYAIEAAERKYMYLLRKSKGI